MLIKQQWKYMIKAYEVFNNFQHLPLIKPSKIRLEGQFANSKVPIFKMKSRNLPGSPVVKTLYFHCKGHRFDSLLGNQDPTFHMAWPKKKKN